MRNASRAALAAALAMPLLASCQATFEGLEDLLDPGPTYVAFPGRHLAEGDFTRFVTQGTHAEGAFIVTFDRDDPFRLRILPFDGAPGCDAGPAEAYQPFLRGIRSEHPGVIPFLESSDRDRRGPLRFVSFTCEVMAGPIDDGELPFTRIELKDPPGYLIRSGGSDLLFVNPWNGTTERLLGDVTQVDFSDDRVWVVSGGELVVLDGRLEEVFRTGTDVTELAVSTSPPATAAYVDGGAVYLLSRELTEPEQVDSEACRVRLPSDWSGGGFSYLAPCADRRLVVLERRRRAAEGASAFARHELGEDAIPTRTPVIRETRDGPVVLYVTHEDPYAESGELWGALLDGAPVRIGRDAALSTVELIWPDRLRLLLDWDGEKGRLVDWKIGGDVVELARDVAELKSNLALSRYDGSTGDVLLLSDDNTTRRLASGVPRRGVLHTVEGRALLTDYDGATGTLLVAPPGGGGFETVASGVGLPGLGFLVTMPGIAYLGGYDSAARTGNLTVRMIATADTFESGRRVREWSEVGWPAPGLLYNVPTGRSAGLWFARAR